MNKMNHNFLSTCCPTKPRLQDRPLVSDETALGIQSLFKLLSNVTRLRMLHALVIHGELRVTDLALKIGMKPQAVSNQLQKLLDRRVLIQRRNGANMFYSIADSCLTGLLEQGLCLVEDSSASPFQGVSDDRD